MRAILAVLLSALMLLLAAPAGVGLAQAPSADKTTQRLADAWDDEIAQVRARLEAGDEFSQADLSQMRETLIDVRARAQEVMDRSAPEVQRIQRRLDDLGAAPADGGSEAPEIARLRTELQDELSVAQVPYLRSQEIVERANTLIEDVNTLLVSVISAQLLTRGPIPVAPETLAAAREDLARVGGRVIEVLRAPFVGQISPVIWANVFFALLGITITFSLQRRVTDRADALLERAERPRAIAWFLVLRNLARILVPAMGAGLLLGVFAAQSTFKAGGFTIPFFLPWPVVVLIAAGWLGGSLFAPRSERYRLLPFERPQARAGSLLTLALGAVLALGMTIERVSGPLSLSRSSLAVLYLPLIVIGALLLWQSTTFMRRISRMARTPIDSGQMDAQSFTIGLRALDLLIVITRGLAALAPFLALAGYLAAARFALFPITFSLGLLGASVVAFEVFNTTAVSLLSRRREETSGATEGGLIPVVVALVIAIAALPVLAMIWGARPADIGQAWTVIRTGTEIGGMRLSLGGIITFAVIMTLFVAGTRFVQALLKGSVLPRTRLDAGGRNAITAGVGYLGITLGLLVAVTAAGIDLTNLAIVAGALSVGIGFGLQTIVSNFVSGLILLIERPIKEGDWIEVAGHMGYVKDISVRSTVIDTFDKAAVIVPNSDLISGVVLNRTHMGLSGRLIVPVGVSYDCDPRHVERVLREIAEDQPMVLLDPKPSVLFASFGDSALNFEIRCYLRDVNSSLSVNSAIHFEIARRFAEEGISIPYPHRQVLVSRTGGALAEA